MLRPSVGVRYYHIDQEEYTDNAGIEYGSVKSDVVTGVVGFEISSDTEIKGYDVSQRGYINATYDITNDSDNMFMKLPNGGGYSINTDDSDDFGVELGYGVEGQITKDVKIGLNYELGLKGDYTSHSGFVNLKYEF